MLAVLLSMSFSEESSSSSSSSLNGDAYALLFNALRLIPISHYLLALSLLFVIVIYNFLEFHFVEDLFSGFRGSPVRLTFNSSSPIYDGVVSKCKIVHGRYLVTPWLSSPHIQTAFLHFFGRPPCFSYRRQLFRLSDGGMIALDWLMGSTAGPGDFFHANNFISKDDTTPIAIVIPGLTSDSAASYIRHLVFNTAKRGWNVVVSNHRGLGGVSITSDCFYNAGWTEDAREVIEYLHHEYPKAPLFAIGTSIGANILVKYLGEEGEKTPVAGAAAICSPWDLLIGDRFIGRRLIQKIYDRALTIGLQDYAQLHEPRYSRLANWEGIKKSRSIRDFDNHATCLVGKFETVDTYYRNCSSSTYVGNVSIPLLCISSLDDPVCTVEAIPLDECRANKNVVLATTWHGGHLAFFEGITAAGMWWVRAVNEYLGVLHSSPYMHVQKKVQEPGLHLSTESSIDQGPYLNVSEDGMVAAVGNEQTRNSIVGDHQTNSEMVLDTEQDEQLTGAKSDAVPNTDRTCEPPANTPDTELRNLTASVTSCWNQLSQRNKRSMWLLAYVAIITTWPLVGSALRFIFGKKRKNVLSATLTKR
ncbi:AB hydrolase-1 domain-containing protein [Citrus sinensis]|uniref:AB hydrolase-1 domain-containing protein n=1 Tax=Citrus sinensis TaxID=2711 RepID=A0ACB8KU36_CITSI|nr:AB hydrolase-1 domain-containing protein [Citrus sinensis]